MKNIKEIILSNSIKRNIVSLLNDGKRSDEREFYEYRKIDVKPNVIDTADGSAMAKIGDTVVLAGVKFDVVSPFPSDPNLGVFITGAELLPLASTMFEPGPPDVMSIEFARVVDRAIRSAEIIDMESLFIEEGKVLGIFLDLYVLNYDGNLIDAGSLAAITALANTKMPKVEDGQIVWGEYEGKLKIDKYPVTTTFAKIDKHIVLDPSIDEESAMDCRFSIGTIEGYVTSMQKGGGSGTLTKEDVLKLIDISFEKSKELRKHVRVEE